MTQLPKIVTTRLSGARSSEHPDADLLTAFTECALAGRERDRVLDHLSGCSECRQVVALALPELISQKVPIQPSTSWLRTPVLRWGAVAACIVVVAAAVLIRKGELSTHHGEVQVAQQQAVPAPEIQMPAASEATGGPKSSLSKSETKAKAGRSPAPNVQRTPPEIASANVPATAPNEPVSANAASSDLMKRSETPEMQAEAAPAPAAPSAGADQQLRARNSAARSTATPLFMPRPSTETAASTIGGAAKLTDLRPPSWRLSQDGLPERSFASDHWEKVQVDHRTGFRAIAALGMEVWIGGPGGLLYHSEDMGLNWTRMIPVTSSATLADDITGIAFTDHLHGKVETTGGRSWVTSDAGKTWELQ